MSLPTIPNLTPNIALTKEQVISVLLASIGLEEIGLSHIINAEAEKIQAVVGTLPDRTDLVASQLSDLIAVNESVDQTLNTVIKKEMLLQMKLEDIIELIRKLNIHKNTVTVEGFFFENSYTATDIAYYNTGLGPVQ